MPGSLLNLVSTPMPVLNTLGLNLRVGLSSEDPMAGRPSEPFEAFLSVYSPEGSLLERMHLGQIPANRRRYFDVSAITKKLVPDDDHLVVAHRVPSRLDPKLETAEIPVELDQTVDYSMYRGLVEYSYPEGGNGSVIYETAPNLNANIPGRKSSNTLMLTSQTVISELTESHIILIHSSVSPSYCHTATFNFAFNNYDGGRLLSDQVTIPPFSIKVLDVGKIIPADVIEQARDLQDGLSAFTFVGYSDDAALQFIVLSLTPSIGGVGVEHTHPTQTYLFPLNQDHRRAVKETAQSGWKRIWSGGDQERVGS
jgi:hypothetical protein